VPYDLAGRLEPDLRSAGVAWSGRRTAPRAAHRRRPASDEARLAALVAELTAGAGLLVPGEDRWVDRA